MGKIIGIDLGTTNSVVAVMEGGQPQVITNEEGGRTTPSVVGFGKNGLLVGQMAKRQAVVNPENTIYSIKRFMGRRYDEIQEEIKMVPYKAVSGKDKTAEIQIGDKSYAPPEISAHVLRKLKESAEAYLGEEITEAVITVPAYFNDSQRQATKDAGKIAGLDVKRIINEPTAAALAYGLDKKKDEIIAVYDFGGGTFDISILEVGDNVVEVKATNGDTHLGGDNLDDKIVQWLMEDFKKEHNIDLIQNVTALQRLKEGAEKAKIELSTMLSTDISLPFITQDETGPKHINTSLTRSKFEQLVEEIIERSASPCYKALEDAGYKPEDINQVVLVGGSTRIPRVQELVKKIFAKEPHKGVNPDEVVGIGAAVQGGVLSGDVKDVLLLDVIPLSLGVETLGGEYSVLIERNTTIPTKRTETFTTAEEDQEQVEVHVLQGERPLAKDNKSLGKFYLKEIPPAPRGIPQIEVSFDIDANGILNVSAQDLKTQNQQSITIKDSGKIAEEEIENMVKDAERFAEEDKQRKQLIEQTNSLDHLIYQTNRVMKEKEADLKPENTTTMNDYLNQAQKTMEEKNVDAMKEAAQAIVNYLKELKLLEEEPKQETQEEPEQK